MLKRSVTQTKGWTWAASSSVEEDIIKDGYITHIDFIVELTPAVALTGANQPDGPFRLIQNFSIKGGTQTYFSLPAEQGGRLWHYMMRQLMGHIGHGTGGITAPNLTNQPVLFRYHPGSRPKNADGSTNFFDMTAFVPAIEESSLTGTWLTTQAADITDDTNDISSAAMRATIYMVQGEPHEILSEMMAQGVPMDPSTGRPVLMTPAPTAEVFAHTAAKADYSEERDLPTGGFLRGIGFLCQDAVATATTNGPFRASDETTQIAIKMPGIGAKLIETDTEPLWCGQPSGSYLEVDDAALDGGQFAPNGVFYLPLKDRGISPIGREYGINLMGARTGDWKLGLTISTYTSGDDTLIWYDRLIPYTGSALRV